MLEQATQEIIVYAIAAIVAFIAFTFKQLVGAGLSYLRIRIGKDSFNRLVDLGDMVVRYLEQSPVFKEFDGARKKELARIEMMRLAEWAKIDLDPELADRIIEAAVQKMNAENGKLDWEELSAPIIPELTAGE